MTTNITPIEAKTREAIKKHKNCKYRQFCKSTLRGKWIDCMLGKGLVCNPNLHYCKYEKYIPRETAQALAPQEQQQKTFTVDEIREILFSFGNDDCINSENPNICKLGGFDCRECIMKKFEKEVE